MPLTTLSKNDDYEKPDKTYTESLNPGIIAFHLQNYRHLPNNDFIDVHLGSTIKYFIKKDDKYLYRIGGMLANKSNWEQGYIVLMSGYGKKWSVQLNNSIIFVKMNNTEIKQMYDERINNRQDYLEKLIYDSYKKEFSKKQPSKKILNSLQKYGEYIDTQKIKVFMIVRGYKVNDNTLTKNIQVMGTEKYKGIIIGLRYICADKIILTEKLILPTANFYFVVVGNYKDKFDKILKKF